MKDNIEYCPKCKINFQGNPIPKEDQKDYGATHFSNKIGISNWDSVYAWHCLSCKYTWDRWTGKEIPAPNFKGTRYD